MHAFPGLGGAMIVLNWLSRIVGMALIGSAVLAGFSAMGLYQAAALVQQVKDFLAIDVLNLIYLPFDWISFAWFEITVRERAYVAMVWAIMILPSLRNMLATSNPDLVPAAFHAGFQFTLVNFPFSLIGGTMFALLMGLCCFILPDALSTLALVGWMSFIQWTLLTGIISFMFAPVPDEGDEAVSYEYVVNKYRVMMVAKTYGEMAVGTMLVYWTETLFLAPA